MTERKPPQRHYAAGVGIVPPVPYELTDDELNLFEQTYREHTHLRPADVDLVAQYATQSVLVRMLARRVALNGATVATRTGGAKRSPDAIALDAATQAVASLERRLTLTAESQRRAGVLTLDQAETAPLVELTRRRGERAGLAGDELTAYVNEALRGLGLA